MMVWNVFYHSINGDSIETFNIFDHSGFAKDFAKATQECKEKSDFACSIERSLKYYFWSKSEYEVLITAWVGGGEGARKKVDVYRQVALNWGAFIDYVWSNKEKWRELDV